MRNSGMKRIGRGFVMRVMRKSTREKGGEDEAVVISCDYLVKLLIIRGYPFSSPLLLA
jgi:hypothetical protein